MMALVLARTTTVMLGIWLLSLGGMILVSALRGRILTAGLLRSRKTGGMSASRMQLLVMTILFGAGYFGAALAGSNPKSLPDIPFTLLAAVLGSHGTYLGGKYWSLRS
jgi:hypothetical protein